MKCIECGKEMEIKKKDSSRDEKNGKEYARIIWWCSADDIWITVEEPAGPKYT